MYGYVYKTTNNINNKIYIGQKKSDKFIPSYKGSGKLLRKAIEKYGKESFNVEIVCWATSKKELDDQERYWIKKLNSRNSDVGYNLAEGGEGSNGGGFKGKHHSPESKEKHRQAALLDAQRRKANNWKPFQNARRPVTSPNKGKKRIKKDGKYKYVDTEELDRYVQDGWCHAISENSAAKKSSYKPKYPGLTRQEINKLIGQRLRGVKRGPRSAETKQKLHEANKGKSPNNKGKKMMYKEFEQLWVSPEDIPQYLEKGYILGRKFYKQGKVK